MNLQQLEYIVAVNKHRQFVIAAEQCGVTQPTLSTMIQKLEAELGISIFDRTKHPVEPTTIGRRIVAQAEATLREMRRIQELVQTETNSLAGTLKIGVIPTLAPYLIPEFIHRFRSGYAEVELTISEKPTASLIEALHRDELDMFIAATPLEQADFLEIPLYYEKFVAYFAPNHPLKTKHLSANNMPQDNLWVLQEGHCVRDQIFNFCHTQNQYNHIYEAGSIETLIRIVEKNGGYSVIPELHLDFLTDAQRQNVQPITCPPAVREISLVIKKDFIRERLINAVADTIKKIMPNHMLDERLKKFSIRL
jgi:LysR family transcriptional regulator, hydrogen peroxide-inducible genes activator